MGKHFYTPVLDRKTGELVELDQGEYVSVSEFGAAMGMTPRKIRKVLHALDLVQPEGSKGTYRLTHDAVRRGLGKRIVPKRAKYAFDVLSPAGQDLVRGNLDAALARLDDQRTPVIGSMTDALEAYMAAREAAALAPMVLNMEVCWLADFFPQATPQEIAEALQAPAGVVRMYLHRRRAQHDAAREFRTAMPQNIQRQNLSA